MLNSASVEVVTQKIRVALNIFWDFDMIRVLRVEFWIVRDSLTEVWSDVRL